MEMNYKEIFKQLEYKKRLRQQQATKLMEKFKRMDMNNEKEILKWFCNSYTYINTIGVKMARGLIVDVLNQSYNYDATINLYHFEKPVKPIMRNMITQCISYMKYTGGIPKELIQYIKHYVK